MENDLSLIKRVLSGTAPSSDDLSTQASEIYLSITGRNVEFSFDQGVGFPSIVPSLGTVELEEQKLSSGSKYYYGIQIEGAYTIALYSNVVLSTYLEYGPDNGELEPTVPYEGPVYWPSYTYDSGSNTISTTYVQVGNASIGTNGSSIITFIDGTYNSLFTTSTSLNFGIPYLWKSGDEFLPLYLSRRETGNNGKASYSSNISPIFNCAGTISLDTSSSITFPSAVVFPRVRYLSPSPARGFLKYMGHGPYTEYASNFASSEGIAHFKSKSDPLEVDGTQCYKMR